jgi:pimeloyl-ACP methyl ester carboxylesterase
MVKSHNPLKKENRMKLLSRIFSIRIAWYLACVAMLVATTFFTGTAMATGKAGPYPESLQKWVDGGKYVKFKGLDIFVHASGTAPVKGHGVLVVHGYPGSSWDFSNVASQVEKKTKIVIPDMVGFGQSETPLTGTFKDNFSLLKQADLYEAVAAAEGLKTVILVAHDMGQTVGLELMARQEEGKLPFRIKHAILLNGSTLVDLINTTPGQDASLKLPDKALTEDPPREEWYKDLIQTYGTKMRSSKDELQTNLDCQVAQIYANDGAKVMSNIVRYLLERKEFYDRWVGTFTGFHSAPMTVIWGLDDPVALESMADRVKAWRPETDLYKLKGIGHWPSIEAADYIAEAILHRLDAE